MTFGVALGDGVASVRFNVVLSLASGNVRVRLVGFDVLVQVFCNGLDLAPWAGRFIFCSFLFFGWSLGYEVVNPHCAGFFAYMLLLLFV